VNSPGQGARLSLLSVSVHKYPAAVLSSQRFSSKPMPGDETGVSVRLRRHTAPARSAARRRSGMTWHRPSACMTTWGQGLRSVCRSESVTRTAMPLPEDIMHAGDFVILSSAGLSIHSARVEQTHETHGTGRRSVSMSVPG
jgi:hypothetical protein